RTKPGRSRGPAAVLRTPSGIFARSLDAEGDRDRRHRGPVLLAVEVGLERDVVLVVAGVLEVQEPGDLAVVFQDALGQAHALHLARGQLRLPATVLAVVEAGVARQLARPGLEGRVGTVQARPDEEALRGEDRLHGPGATGLEVRGAQQGQ